MNAGRTLGMRLKVALRPQRRRVGLAVGQRSVRAVAVRGDRVLWVAESPLDDARPLEEALREAFRSLFANVPRDGWQRVAMPVAIGPSRSQTKRIVGLPPMRDVRDVERLVRAGITRFFLKNGVPLVITGVAVTDTGDVLAAVVDETLLDAMALACASHGIRLGPVIPTVAVLGRALSDSPVRWADGTTAVEVTTARQCVNTVRRIAVHEVTSSGESLIGPLRCLGADGLRFADAYGAATLSGFEALALLPSRGVRGSHGPPRWRIRLAYTALLLSVAAMVLAPAASARVAARRDARRLTELKEPREKVSAAAADLRLVTDALGQVANFDAKRRSTALAMASFAQALPPNAFLVAVRLDTLGGTLVALSPRAADVVARLERSLLVASPEILGPVTRERVDGVDRERVTVRFRWLDAQSGRRR